ncbi:MAG TPA: VOC family protein, partial [Candidatus Paceibacterota bacterium]|nr:VOC family protein [Candidatus Paceibacterota bacterium]
MIHGLNHFNIQSRDLRVTEDFYCGLLGFKVGPRPPFQGDGLWLYVDGDPMIHVGLRTGHNTEMGPIDHVALTA